MQSRRPTQAAGLRDMLRQLASTSRPSWGCQNRWQSSLPCQRVRAAQAGRTVLSEGCEQWCCNLAYLYGLPES